MNTKRSITALNSLITIHNDRIEGYESASKKTKEVDLSDLFFRLSQTSQKCKTELLQEVLIMGGKPPKINKIAQLFKALTGLGSVLRNKNRRAIFKSCERKEIITNNTYSDILKNKLEDISEVQLAMIGSQHVLIKADHVALRNLRDTPLTKK